MLYAIKDETLTAIGDAIRSKNGLAETYTPTEMATAISEIKTSDVPEELIKLTGDCSYAFNFSSSAWCLKAFELYKHQMTTENITDASYMFNGCKTDIIPFEINLASKMCPYNFCRGSYITEVPKINNFIAQSSNEYPFRDCLYLRELKDSDCLNWTFLTSSYNRLGGYFSGCHSLRKVSPYFIKNYWNTAQQSFSFYYQYFQDCYALDEVVNLPVVVDTALTSNVFTGTVNNCSHLKEFTFEMNEDNTPKVAQWQKQTLYLNNWVGTVNPQYENRIYSYNSGITADKKVTDDATYQALKNDEDYWTTIAYYSRYNKASAINTINSLPDCSAYLVSSDGTANTIRFTGNAGLYTDGGGINTLTEEEIAVATAKGWTVSIL